MNPTNKRRLRVATPTFVMTIAAVMAVCPGFGQGTFGRAASQPFSGGVTVVNQLPMRMADRLRVPGRAPGIPATMSVELGGAMQQSWQNLRPGLQKDIENALHERDIGGGFRTSANHLSLAETGQLFAGTDGRGFTVRLLLPGNQLATRIRIPGPSAQSSDPALTLPFDIDAIVDVDINGMQLNARSAKVRLIPHEIYGRNSTGKLAVAASSLVNFFGGPDLQREVASRINGQQFTFDGAINKGLAKVNSALANAGSDAVLQPGFDPTRRNVQITLMKASAGPVVR